jgi:hypothetical protein
VSLEPEIRPPEMQINLIKQRLAAILPAISAGTKSELHRAVEWSAVQMLPNSKNQYW